VCSVRAHAGGMRSIWKGAITFGLVNVPVKVYSATEDHDLPLHQVHDADGGRIRYQRRCEVCGKIVDFGDIDKAYDDGERTVVLTDDDLATLPSERSKEIDVVEFVPSEQLDPIMFDRSYFLEPDGSSPKAYVLLRRTLEEQERTAIVLFSLRQKTRLAALRVRGDVLMLQTLLWDDEVREARFPSLDAAVRLGAKELEMSRSLVESFASDFAPEQFTDEYQEELRKLVEAKLAKGDAMSTEETFGESSGDEEGGGEVLSLMDALQRSIEANRSKKGGAKQQTTTKPAAKRQTATKPAAATKTGAKKTAATKTAAKKPAAKRSSAAKKSA